MADNKPLVSIGLPVYNGERFLVQTLDSLLAQNYENFELIISDNASTDHTKGICEGYAKSDPRIRLYRNEENIGLTNNFKGVLELAQGEYFMWAAHDDQWDSNYISSLVTLLTTTPDVALACPMVKTVNVDNRVLSEHRFPDQLGHMKALRRICALLSSLESGWVYGLFRIEGLRTENDPCHRFVWANDILLLLRFVLNYRVAGTNATVFYQRKTGLSARIYKPQSLRDRLRFVGWLFSGAWSSLFHSRLSVTTKLLLILPVLWCVDRNAVGLGDLLVGRSRRVVGRLVRGVLGSASR